MSEETRNSKRRNKRIVHLITKRQLFLLLSFAVRYLEMKSNPYFNAIDKFCDGLHMSKSLEIKIGIFKGRMYIQRSRGKTEGF